MQSTAPTTLTQSDIFNNMQPQSAQNMYISSSGTNNNGNVRTNQQAGVLFRNPSASPAPRGARHVPMQQMYPQTMHQSVVVPAFSQYAPRQPQFQAQQYSYSQPMPQNYYPFQYFPALQQPQAHQRNAVGVNTGVGNSMAVQNGPLNGPPGTSQTQIPLTAGTVITGAVPPCTSAVMGVSTPSTGQVGVPSMVSVVPTGVPTQQPTRRRKHALEIIDPETNKNILEDLDLSKNSVNSEVDTQDHITSVPSAIQPEISMSTPQQDHATIGSGIILMTDSRPNMQYNIDLHQFPQQREVVIVQTPIVSAMSDAPSVEILPTPQKLRNKKILSIEAPKDDQTTAQINPKPSDDLKQQQKNKNNVNEIANSTKLDCVQQQPSQQYQTIQVPEINTQQLKTAPTEKNRDLDSTTFVPQSINITKEVTDLTDKNTTSILSASNSSGLTNISNQPHETIALSTTIEPQQNILEENQHLNSEELSILPQILDSLQNMKLNNPLSSIKPIIESIPSESHPTIETDSRKGGLQKNTMCDTLDNRLTSTVDSNKNETTYIKQIDSPETNIVSVPIASDETDRSVPPLTKTLQKQMESSLVHITCDKNDMTKSEYSDNIDIDHATNIGVSTNDDFSTEETKTLPIITSTTDSEGQQQPIINYNEGQWSPNNPTGKKQYNREQLMQLREARASRIQPEVKNVSILPQPNLMPSFVRNTNKGRVQSMVGSIGGNRSNDGGVNNANFAKGSMSGVHQRNSMKGGMIHVNLSLNQDVKLNETDNAWRPRALVKTGESEIDPNIKTKREKDDLVRRVRGILNKLTPEKFDALVEEIIKLKIDTPDKMEDVMVLVFEKAIDEPNFSVSYARLCHRLITEVKARDERMESGTKTNLAHFRNALLDKTEREFTHNVTQSSAKAIKLQPIIDKIKKCSDNVEKAELEALLEEEERKIRRRSGGTVRFIGELFKISMLTGKIISSCISALLNPNSEDMLECMCKLLTTVGAKFEQTPIYPKDPNTSCYSLDNTIAQMQAIASKPDKDGSKVSSRVRFMLQDVIDLRKNKWQSTRNEAPKTMDQIEKETKTEQLSSQYLNYAGSMSGNSSSSVAQGASGKRDDRGSNRYNDSRSSSSYGGSHSQRGDTGSLRRQQGGNGNNSSGGHSNGNNDDNTWHVQTSKGSRSLAVDTNKLGMLTQSLDIGSKKMGGVSQFIWSNNAARQSTPSTTPSNSFAVLSSLPDSNKSNDRGDRNGPRNKSSYNKGSMERDRYADRNMHSSRTGSSQASRENSSSRGPPGGRGIINSSSIQKSTSHSKYTQQMPSSRLSGKSQGNAPITTASSNIYPHRSNDQLSSPFTSHHSHPDSISNSQTDAAPAAVFETPNDSDMKIIKSVVNEMVESAATSKTINSSVVSCIDRLKYNQRCGFLYYILTEYLHLGNVGRTSRRNLANCVALLIKNSSISVDHFRLSYANFCELASDLIVDIPALWLYIFEFTGPLIAKKIITVNDLWIKQLKDDNPPNFGQKFLKIYLTCCTREIGPSFTRSMWKNSNMKWTDFLQADEVENFINSNKLDYIENELIQPELEVKETKDQQIIRVVEHIDHLLKDGTNADSIIDYINGNILDIDKNFIKSLTTVLCKSAITHNDGSYKLDTECFQNICMPVLQRCIDSNVDRELECLYSMQVLVHTWEHPRGLLSELFGEIYDADVIPQESFIKWRDSKDQSAGKGVAVKGVNPFFSHVLSSETSDENN